MQQILAACERGAALNRQLLALGRRQKLTLQVIDVSKLIGEVEKILAPGGGRGRRAAHPAGARRGSYQGRRRAAGAGADQPGGQCPGGDALGRRADHRGRQPQRRRGASARGGRPPGQLRDGGRERHRDRDGRCHPGADVRAVLQHQGHRAAHRPGAGHGLRHHPAEPRPHHRRQRAWPGHQDPHLPAPHGRPGGAHPAPGRAAPVSAAHRDRAAGGRRRPAAAAGVRGPAPRRLPGAGGQQRRRGAAGVRAAHRTRSTCCSPTWSCPGSTAWNWRCACAGSTPGSRSCSCRDTPTRPSPASGRRHRGTS